MPFVYIIQCADDTLYTGWAVDVTARVKVHNAGRGARYTKTRRPVSLLYSEELPTRADAMRRERQIKKLPRLKKLALATPPSKKKGPRRTSSVPSLS
jgi:putative endonuclease